MSLCGAHCLWAFKVRERSFWERRCRPSWKRIRNGKFSTCDQYFFSRLLYAARGMEKEIFFSRPFCPSYCVLNRASNLYSFLRINEDCYDRILFLLGQLLNWTFFREVLSDLWTDITQAAENISWNIPSR